MHDPLHGAVDQDRAQSEASEEKVGIYKASRPVDVSVFDALPMNRVARRAAARQAKRGGKR